MSLNLHAVKSPYCKTPCSPAAAPPPFPPIFFLLEALVPLKAAGSSASELPSFREWPGQPRGRGTQSHGRKRSAAVLPRYSLMQLCLGRRQETLLGANCGNGAHDGAIVYEGRLRIALRSAKRFIATKQNQPESSRHWEQMLFSPSSDPARC